MTPDALAKAEAERQTHEGRAERAILDGEERFSTLRCPVLAIFAYPHELPGTVTGTARTQAEAQDMAFVDQRVKLFKAQPDATVVLLPHATHGVQDSRRAEVMQAIQNFASRVQH